MAKDYALRTILASILSTLALFFWTMAAAGSAGAMVNNNDPDPLYELQERLATVSATCHREFQQFCRFPPIHPRLQPQCELWRQCRDFDTVNLSYDVKWSRMRDFFWRHWVGVASTVVIIFAFFFLAAEDKTTPTKKQDEAEKRKEGQEGGEAKEGTAGKAPSSGPATASSSQHGA
ncbi:hypothetical protein JCM8097_002895 [Rhodosporidiobolus ruineniae]